MNAIWERIKSEPAIVTMLVNQAFLFGAAFGFSLTPEQLVQINALLALILTFITRQTVTPISKLTESELRKVEKRKP
jgi:hypothetical protein